MINRYNDFLISEKKLILEAFLSAESEFTNRLSKIGFGTDKIASIAREIVDNIHSEEWISSEDIKQDFFNITNDNDKVSFIQSNRVKDSDSPYTMNGRGEIKVGRAIRYICDLYEIEVNDKNIEDIVNKYKSISEKSTGPSFKFLIGDDIKKGYDTDNYSSERGSLSDSCMNDEFSYLRIYTKNEKNIRLLILEDEDGITGRAIVWKLDTSPCEAEYFMDRIYFNHDYQVDTFREYAKENGWMYKKRMSYGYDEAVQFVYKEKDVFGEIRVKLEDGDFEEYPFLDTLPFLSRDKKELSNIPSRRCFILHDTEGERDRCNECKGRTKNDSLCDDCCGGVRVLNKKGIDTNVERNKKGDK